MVGCAVIECERYERDENWQTFPLPKANKGLRRQWLETINIKIPKDYDLDKSFRVCSRHFKESNMFYKTDKSGRISKKRFLKPKAVPTENLFRRKLLTAFKPRRTRTAMKAFEPLPEAEPKFLGKSNKGIYAAFYYRNENQRQKVLVPMENDHFR